MTVAINSIYVKEVCKCKKHLRSQNEFLEVFFVHIEKRGIKLNITIEKCKFFIILTN